MLKFELEGTLEEEDDSDCFEDSWIVEVTSRKTGNTDWCLCELREPVNSEKESLYCHSVQTLKCILADSDVNS